VREIALDRLDFRAFVRPGDVVLWSPSTAEPVPLIDALIAQRADLGGIGVLLGTSYSKSLQVQHADHISFKGISGAGGARRLAAAGMLDILPVHVSQLPALIRSGALRVDVVLVQLSVDADGNPSSLGAADLCVGPAIAAARTVIAEVNESAPWTYGRIRPDLSKLAAYVRTRRPLVEVPPTPPDADDRRIAARIASLIPDGAVLQVGVGGVSQALGDALLGHKALGIHSGTIGDLLVDLTEKGVVTNERKPFDRGVSVTATLLGSKRLFDFAHHNKAVRVDDASYVHAPATLGRLDRLISINSAVEVDLTGQVNSEIADGTYLGAVGGQVDFIRGAVASRGGRSIVALRSVGKSQTASRIVPQIKSGVCTTARSDIDVIVTEFGIADLRGRSISERIAMMIGITHPDFREDLARAGRSICGTVTREPQCGA